MNGEGLSLLDGGGAADYSSLWIAGSGNYAYAGVINLSTSIFMAGAPGATQTLSGANTFHNISGAGAAWVCSGTLTGGVGRAISTRHFRVGRSSA